MGIKAAYDKISILKSIIGLKPKELYPKGIEGFVQEVTDRAITHTLDEALLIIKEECPEVLEEQEGIKAAYIVIKNRKRELAALLPLIEEDPSAHTQAYGIVEGLEEALIAIESKCPEVKEDANVDHS